VERAAGSVKDPKRISRATITEQLEDALRIDIQVGILRPGQRIRSNEVADRYGVSATPLREALQRLAGESLIDLDPRLGATVAPMSERDIHDIYEMLQLLDGIALERSIERGDTSWLADVERAWDALSDAVAQREALPAHPSEDERRRIGMLWSAAHWTFHEALYEKCGSPWLMRFVRQLHAHADRYQMLTLYEAAGLQRDSRAEHGDIYRAAKARDVDAAVKALRDHLGLTVRLLASSIQQDGLLRQSPTGALPGTPSDP
jgi:GntR family carbon starvation induced transcriptional regulator